MDTASPASTPTSSPSNTKAKVLGTIAALVVVGAIGDLALHRLSPSSAPDTTPVPTNDQDTDTNTVVAPTTTDVTPPVATTTDVTATSTGTSAAATTTPVTTTTKPSASVYKDGTYTAEGDYTTHVGPESIQITLTLKNDVITDSQFSGTPNAPMSQRFMDMFSQNYKTMVVGKNIDQVNLGKVSGSSLTPIGFNDALAKIKAQAKG